MRIHSGCGLICSNPN